MSAKNPTVNDLLTVSRNLKSEGHHSRADVIRNAATTQQEMQNTIHVLMENLAVLTARVEAAEAEAGKLREALGTVDKIVFSIGEYSADGLRKAIMKVVLDNARRVKLQESEK
jgi:hypothetical protein